MQPKMPISGFINLYQTVLRAVKRPILGSRDVCICERCIPRKGCDFNDLHAACYGWKTSVPEKTAYVLPRDLKSLSGKGSSLCSENLAHLQSLEHRPLTYGVESNTQAWLSNSRVVSWQWSWPQAAVLAKRSDHCSAIRQKSEPRPSSFHRTWEEWLLCLADGLNFNLECL